MSNNTEWDSETGLMVVNRVNVAIQEIAKLVDAGKLTSAEATRLTELAMTALHKRKPKHRGRRHSDIFEMLGLSRTG